MAKQGRYRRRRTPDWEKLLYTKYVNDVTGEASERTAWMFRDRLVIEALDAGPAEPIFFSRQDNPTDFSYGGQS